MRVRNAVTLPAHSRTVSHRRTRRMWSDQSKKKCRILKGGMQIKSNKVREGIVPLTCREMSANLIVRFSSQVVNKRRPTCSTRLSASHTDTQGSSLCPYETSLEEFHPPTMIICFLVGKIQPLMVLFMFPLSQMRIDQLTPASQSRVSSYIFTSKVECVSCWCELLKLSESPQGLTQTPKGILCVVIRRRAAELLLQRLVENGFIGCKTCRPFQEPEHL